MAKLFVNIGDPDQMPHSVVSDQGLHCLPITLFKGLKTTTVNAKELFTEQQQAVTNVVNVKSS